MEISKQPGSYIVLSKLFVETQIGSGQFADRPLPVGIYFYSGSAFGPGGLRARIGRHLRLRTKKHWHFDHIKEYLEISEIWYSTEILKHECQFIRRIRETGQATFPVPGFGSSDCSCQCPAHLAHLPMDVDLAIIFKELNQVAMILQRVPIDKSDRIVH